MKKLEIGDVFVIRDGATRWSSHFHNKLCFVSSFSPHHLDYMFKTFLPIKIFDNYTGEYYCSFSQVEQTINLGQMPIVKLINK